MQKESQFYIAISAEQRYEFQPCFNNGNASILLKKPQDQNKLLSFSVSTQR